jgi:hypothetical protein
MARSLEKMLNSDLRLWLRVPEWNPLFDMTNFFRFFPVPLSTGETSRISLSGGAVAG